MSTWPERPVREGRTRDRRDCQHCRHYASAGGGGGTPPWAVCQFWPRKNPATCNSYAYEHRAWLTEGGELWRFAAETAPSARPAEGGDGSKQ